MYTVMTVMTPADLNTYRTCNALQDFGECCAIWEDGS